MISIKESIVNALRGPADLFYDSGIVAREMRGSIRVQRFRLLNFMKNKYTCPACNYSGPFVDMPQPMGVRLDAQCPKCGAMEEHRLQWHVLDRLVKEHNFKEMWVLHMPPSPHIAKWLVQNCHIHVADDMALNEKDYYEYFTESGSKGQESSRLQSWR